MQGSPDQVLHKCCRPCYRCPWSRGSCICGPTCCPRAMGSSLVQIHVQVCIHVCTHVNLLYAYMYTHINARVGVVRLTFIWWLVLWSFWRFIPHDADADSHRTKLSEVPICLETESRSHAAQILEYERSYAKEPPGANAWASTSERFSADNMHVYIELHKDIYIPTLYNVCTYEMCARRTGLNSSRVP